MLPDHRNVLFLVMYSRTLQYAFTAGDDAAAAGVDLGGLAQCAGERLEAGFDDVV